MSSKTPALAETIDAAAAPSVGETKLFQDRLVLYGLVGAFLCSTAMVLIVATHLRNDNIDQHWPTYILHAVAIVSCLLGWLICRGAPRSRHVLGCVDVVMTLSVEVCFAAMCASYPAYTRPDLIVSLTTILVTTTRAVIVPSSARRTLVLSTLAWLPAFVTTYVVWNGPTDYAGVPSLPVAVALEETGTWAILAIALVTIASRVIYGLRREVREAQKLGQYTLLEKLGEGGMGQVFRARHAMLRRPTAVKLLHPDRIGGAEDLARFEREVQLTAQLSHPNVVTVFDYGRTPDGVFYYAMELLDGQNLEDVVARSGAMSAARAVHVVTQVASALAEAHAVGLIHRDIKPANIILSARGSMLDVAKVVDFGLVKQLGEAAEEVIGKDGSVDGRSSHVSKTGTILGTPMYLAPEAMSAPGALDGRADLYALGAVAYFLLTGTVVFGGESVAEACRHHLHTTPEAPSARLRSLRGDADIPADVEAIVLRCLAKSPADRPASAKDLVEALRSCSVAEWTDADARAAWASAARRPAAGASHKTETSWTAKTIAVDLAR
ncbi:MAG: serine/threonine kinase [Labilithrix sp.]|nr:serine/threonine kinase [Labilithrix sp.]